MLKKSTGGGNTFTSYYYLLNHRGDVVALMESDYTIVAKYSYTAWGEILSVTDGNGTAVASTNTTHIANLNPLRYRSYYYDTETGFYYLLNRYYDPVTHRFINADSVLSSSQSIGGTNAFSYCGNNPVNRLDKSGNFWDTVFDVISIIVSVVDVAMNPDDVGAWAGLAGDVIDIIPFVTGVGETIRACRTTTKVIEAADELHDISKAVDNTTELLEAAGDAARRVDFYVTPDAEAIPSLRTKFNENLSLMDGQNGKYYGVDSKGPIRIRPNEVHEDNLDFSGVIDPFHTAPHFHIDRRINGATGKWIKTFTGLMEMLQ